MLRTPSQKNGGGFLGGGGQIEICPVKADPGFFVSARVCDREDADLDPKRLSQYDMR